MQRLLEQDVQAALERSLLPSSELRVVFVPVRFGAVVEGQVMFMQRLLEQNVQAALDRLLLPSGGLVVASCLWQ
jgi:hypothetical protein